MSKVKESHDWVDAFVNDTFDKMKQGEEILEKTISMLKNQILHEENAYQIFFKKELESAGKSIPEMTEEEKKDFFNGIKKKWAKEKRK